MLDNSQNAVKTPVQPPVKTIMGLDFGIAKMGIALGNTLTQTAQPLMQFKMDNGKPDWDELLKVITQWQVSTIVIGLPLNMDGSESELGNRAKKFARRLNHQLEMAHIGCEIVLADERLTSREARNLAWEYGLIKKENEPIDSIASAIMLGSWLRENTS